MIIVLWWSYWAITALTLLCYIWTRSILAHSHLLRMWKFILKLILSCYIATLAGTLICSRHISDTNGVGWFRIHSNTTCILDATLNIFLIYIWSWVQRGRHISWLHNSFARASTLASSYWRHTKSTCLWNAIWLHVLHLLRLWWIRHATAFILSSTHFLKWIITTVSLTFRLVWTAKSASGPLWFLLSLRHITLLIHITFLSLINVIYLYIIEAVVKVSHV